MSGPANWRTAGSTFYRTFIKRNSTFLSLVVVGAFVTESATGFLFDNLWSYLNQGKLWADFKRDQLPAILAKKAAEEGGEEAGEEEGGEAEE
jgi:hypothetical protein